MRVKRKLLFCFNQMFSEMLAQKFSSHYCVPQNKNPFKMRANMFLSIKLFPWRLGSSIIVFGTQTETDQTRRQPTDQNGSCGSGTLHALIRFGLGWVGFGVCTLKHPPQSVSDLAKLFAKNGQISAAKSWGAKAKGCYSPPPSVQPGPADSP